MFTVFPVIKSNSCACVAIVNSIVCNFIIKHSIHSMLTMDTIILRGVVTNTVSVNEERKIAL